jgi:hypothetical protein
MKLFAAYLVKNARKCYNNLPDKSIKTYQVFHDAFMKRWGTKKDGRLLLVQFIEMNLQENKYV